MEVVLLFLANAIASSAIGHYVSKGLGKIDSELPDLLDGQHDFKQVEKIVYEKGIQGDVVEFANKTFGESTILPNLHSGTATKQLKVELFAQFVNAGMMLSSRLMVDLLLPSSFIAKNSFTLFSNTWEGIPVFEIIGMEFDMYKKPIFGFDDKPQFHIIPVKGSSEKKEVWHDYLDNISTLREETTMYLKINDTSKYINNKMKYCAVEKMTAGACYFKDALTMDFEMQELLNLKGMYRKSTHWYESIEEMTHGMTEVISKLTLSPDEIEKVRKANKTVRELFEI